MKKHHRFTLIALAVAASFQVSHATDNTLPDTQLSSHHASAHATQAIEKGTFLTLPRLTGNTRRVQTLSVRAGDTTLELQQVDQYKDAVVYTGQMPSLTRSSNDKDDLILVLRGDNRFLALYPDLYQVVYGEFTGEQMRVTFGKPSFNETDYLMPAVAELSQQQLTREGGSTYQADRDAQGNIVIDLLAGFSKAAAKTIVDHEAFAIAQVTTINQALKNSRVEKVRVRLVGTQIIDQDHAITTGTLSSLSTLFQAGIKQYSPDLIAGFFEGNNNDTAVGWGYVNGRYTVNALYSSTVLRHEVGHNVGGGHCPSGHDDAYGWDNGKTKTIQCGNDIGYYSNPDLQDNYGLAIGKQGQANMARIWRTNAEKISAYSPAVVPFEHEDAHLLQQQTVSLSSANGYLERIEFDVPANTRRLVISAVPGPNHEEFGKFSLYLSEGGWPSQNDYDFASREHWNTFLGVAKPASGKWHLAVASKNNVVRDIVIRVQAFTSEEGETPDNPWPASLQNPDAESGNLTGWNLESGQFRVITGQDGIQPHSGEYFFTARSSDSAANHAEQDQMSQTISLERGVVLKGKTTAQLNFMSNGWGDGDTGTVTLLARDEKGKLLKTTQTETKGEHKRWLNNQMSLALPAEAVSLELRVQATKKAGIISDVHYDDFELTMRDQDDAESPVVTLDRTRFDVVATTDWGFGYLVSANSSQNDVSWKWELAEGDKRIYLKSYDKSAAEIVVPKNVTETSAKFKVSATKNGKTGHSYVTINIVQPAVAITGKPDMSPADPATLTAKANFDQVSYAWTLKKNGQNVPGGIDASGQIAKGLAGGEYIAEVFAKSDKGGREASAIHTIKVTEPAQNNDQAFINALTMSMQSMDNGDNVTFSGGVTSSSAATSTPVYSWTLPAGAQNGSNGKAQQQFTIKKTSQAQNLKVKVKVTAGKEARELERDIAVAAQAETGQYPLYQPGSDYKEGDVVKNKHGDLFKCKPWPYTGWCGSESALYYEPGIGLNWSDAWNRHSE
jgi:hypothetical protein